MGAFEDTSQKQFMRERLRAHCLERARNGRARAVQKRRDLSAANGSSSDGFEEVDAFMDDGDEDVVNDEVWKSLFEICDASPANPPLVRYIVGSCSMKPIDPSTHSECHSNTNSEAL